MQRARELGPLRPESPTRRTVLGVPLYVTNAVTAGIVWGLPRDRVMVVMCAGT